MARTKGVPQRDSRYRGDYGAGQGRVIAAPPFRRLVREVAGGVRADVRFQESAVRALREAAEGYLADFFEEAGVCAEHGGRAAGGITARDVRLAHRMTRPALGDADEKP